MAYPRGMITVRPYQNGGDGEGVPCKGKLQSCVSGFNIQRAQACNAVYATMKTTTIEVAGSGDHIETLKFESIYQDEKKYPPFRFAFQVLSCTEENDEGDDEVTIKGRAVVSANSGVSKAEDWTETKARGGDIKPNRRGGASSPWDKSYSVQDGWCPDPVTGDGALSKFDIDSAIRKTLAKVRFFAGELASQDGKYWRQKLFNRILSFRDAHRATFGISKSTTDCNSADDTCKWNTGEITGAGGPKGAINWWVYGDLATLSRRHHCETATSANNLNPYETDPAAIHCGRDDDYNWDYDGVTCLCDGQACDPVTGVVEPQCDPRVPGCNTV